VARARRSQTFRLMALSTELIRFDNTTWASREEVRALLRRESATALRLHTAVTVGDAEWGLPGSNGRNAELVRAMAGAGGVGEGGGGGRARAAAFESHVITVTAAYAPAEAARSQ
jgi:hypothetical protein